MVWQHAERDALPPRGEPALADEMLARALDQVSERHAARTRRLASSALHARRHEMDEVVVDRSAAPLNGAHRVDAATRRQAFLAGDPEGRAVRQAQPARHATVQFVRLELQRHPPAS